MGWYFFSGHMVEPVPVGNGEVVAVRPNTKVFIDPSKETSIEVQRLRARGLLNPCSWPKGAKNLVPAEPIEAKAAEVTPFADAVVENPTAPVEVVAEEAPKKKPKKKAPAKKKAASKESDPEGSEG